MMRRHTWTAVLALAASAACGEPATTPTGPSEVALGLESAMMRWATTRPAAYEVTVRLYCGGCDQSTTRPVVVRVRDGAVERRRYGDTGAEVPADRAAWYPTVPILFAVIADADAKHADRISVTYDGAFGYPSSLFIDYKVDVADEESGYGLTDFHAIP